MDKSRREEISTTFIRTIADIEAKKEDLDMEQRLAKAGLSLSEVVEYALKKTNAELDKQFNPVDTSYNEFKYKLPADIVKKIGGADEQE